MLTILFYLIDKRKIHFIYLAKFANAVIQMRHEYLQFWTSIIKLVYRRYFQLLDHIYEKIIDCDHTWNLVLDCIDT